MIDLTKITDCGLNLSGHVEQLSIEDSNVLHDVDWCMIVMPSSPDFFIEVGGSATLIGTCVRCLESVSAPIVVDSQFLGSNNPGLVAGGNYNLSRQDLDMVFFAGTTLDEEVIIREQFQLQVPTRILCSDTCKGLCHHCGNNLNKSDCKCSSKSYEHSNVLARALVDLRLNLVDSDDNNNG